MSGVEKNIGRSSFKSFAQYHTCSSRMFWICLFSVPSEMKAGGEFVSSENLTVFFLDLREKVDFTVLRIDEDMCMMEVRVDVFVCMIREGRRRWRNAFPVPRLLR